MGIPYDQSSAEIEVFLRSIPEVNSFLSSQDGRKAQRDEIFSGIQKRIAQHLSATKFKEDDWISELAELDLDEASVNDEASSIARLLTRYVLNRPWVFHPWLVQQRIKNRDDDSFYDTHITASHFSIHHSRHCSVVTSKVEMGNYLNIAGSKIKLLSHSDATLGLAGFSPLIEESALQNEAAGLKPPLARSIEDDFVDQYRNHIRLSGTKRRQCATISFFRREESSRSDLETTMIGTRLVVDYAIINLMSQLRTLVDDVGPLSQLLFIRQVSHEVKSQTDGDRHYTEIASIQLKEINDFFDAYGKSRDAVNQSLETSENEHYGSRFASFGTFVASQILSLVHPVFFIFTAGSFFYQFYQFYHSSSHQNSDIILLQNLSPLMESLEPLLKALGIDHFDHDKTSQSAQFEVLHLTSLVVQALNLILQSYLRSAETPFRFEFLTTPISDFILEGANPSPRSLKLYAGSQKLSCLGDMLQNEVLVFGSQKSLFRNRLDVIATPEQVATMWGPAELIKDENCFLSKEEVEEKAQTDVSIPRKINISGIKMQNGIILPSDELVNGVPRWHWKSLNQIDEKDTSRISRGDTSVDIGTRIRIGGTRNLHLTPIGPAYCNKSCPRSTDLCSEKQLGSSFQILGVSDPYFEMNDFTVGLQSGQNVNLVTETTFIRVPGRTAKEELLNSVGFFEFQITEYDQMWGLFVSLCTGVMTRVRLREVVAFMCLHVPHQIPLLPGKTRESSLHAFVEALSGEESLRIWLESLAQEFEQKNLGPGDHLQNLQNQVLSLFRNVLAMLKDTGISKTGDLHLAFITQQPKMHMLALSSENHPWVKVLSDSSLTATFACISPQCFQTMGHKCQNDQWKLPDKFRLATRLNAYYHHLQWAVDSTEILKVGKRYCINVRHLNMVAKVDQFVVSSGEHPFYSITAKRSRVPPFVSQHIRKRADLREENSETAIKCIISGYIN